MQLYENDRVHHNHEHIKNFFCTMAKSIAFTQKTCIFAALFYINNYDQQERLTMGRCAKELGTVF